MTYKNFEEYLENEVFEREGGSDGVLDDELHDTFEAWLECLDVQEMQDFGQEWGEVRYEQGKKDLIEGLINAKK